MPFADLIKTDADGVRWIAFTVLVIVFASGARRVSETVNASVCFDSTATDLDSLTIDAVLADAVESARRSPRLRRVGSVEHRQQGGAYALEARVTGTDRIVYTNR